MHRVDLGKGFFAASTLLGSLVRLAQRVGTKSENHLQPQTSTLASDPNIAYWLGWSTTT